MNVLPPLMRSAQIALALSMLLILETPLGGERYRSLRAHPNLIKASDVTDDGLLFPDTQGEIPPTVRSAPDGWMRFETNGCGQLQRIENNDNMVIYGAFRPGADAEDDDDLDPSDEARAIFGRWLSSHPGVAVVSDAIARSCAGPPPDDQSTHDEDLAPNIDADALNPKRESLRDYRMTIV